MTMCFLNYLVLCVTLVGSSFHPGCTLSSSFEPFSPQCSSTLSASPNSQTSESSSDDKQCGPFPVLKLKGNYKPDLRGRSALEVEGVEMLVIPPRLQFGASQVFVAVTECIEVFNPSTEKLLEVLSITSKSVHFQVAAFEATTLPPLSRLRMPIVFLPRAKQHLVGKVVVVLKGGDSFEVSVEGTGLRNLYQVKAFTNISIPVDTRITPPIHVYNPNDEPLHIKEIYTTESFLHLTLPEQNVIGAKLWEIAPHKNRFVINLSFQSDKPGLFTGLIHLSTEEHLIILPVEITVMEAPLEISPKELDFGYITSATQEQVRVISINNLSLRPIVITNVRTPRPDSMIVKFKRGLVIPPQTTITEAATFYYTTPTLKHADASGKIMIQTNQNSSHRNVVLTYKVRIRPGFLRYPPRSLVFSSVATEQPLPEAWFDPGLYLQPTILRTRRTIVLTNEFAIPLLVQAISTEDSGFEVVGFEPVVVAPHEQFTATLHYYQNLSTFSQKSFLYVMTNLTDFLLPMFVFSGHLSVESEDPDVSEDPEAIMNLLSTFSLLPLGGQLEGEPVVLSRLGILNFGHVVAGTERGHRFVITNRNPVPVTITRVRASSASLHSVFTTYPPEDPSEWRTNAHGLDLTNLPDEADALLVDFVDKLIPPVESTSVNGEGLQLMPGDRVMVQISVRPHVLPRHVSESEDSDDDLEDPPEEEEEGGEFDTPVEVVDEGPVSVWIDTNIRQGDIAIRVHAKGVVGHLELAPLSFPGMFPGRIGNESLFATNHYPVPIQLSLLRSSDSRLTPVLTESVIQPGEKLAIGYVLVIPSQWSTENNYMSDLRGDYGEEDETGENHLFPERDLQAVRLSAERWAKLQADDQTTVRASIQLWSSVVGWSQTEATVELVTPTLTERTSLQFDLLQVNTSKSAYVSVHNPSDETVLIEPLPPAPTSPFALLRVPGLQKAAPLALAPHRTGTVGPVVFSPVTVGSFSAKLFIKNNLTRLSELQLYGVGGSGLLQFKQPFSIDNQSGVQGVTIGGRRVGLADISRLDINFSRYLPSLGLGMTEFGSLYQRDPSGLGVIDSALPTFVASVPFFVLNSGNLPFTISSFSLHGKDHVPLEMLPFNVTATITSPDGATRELNHNSSGGYHGFYIHGCKILPMLLEPQESMPLRVILDPFKLAFTLPLRDVESLHVHTSWGTYSIPIQLSVPEQMAPLFRSIAPPSAPENILRYSLVVSALWLMASLSFQFKERCQSGSREDGSRDFPRVDLDTDDCHVTDTSVSPPPINVLSSAITLAAEETEEQPESETTPKASKKGKKKKKRQGDSTTPIANRRASEVEVTPPSKQKLVEDQSTHLSNHDASATPPANPTPNSAVPMTTATATTTVVSTIAATAPVTIPAPPPALTAPPASVMIPSPTANGASNNNPDLKQNAKAPQRRDSTPTSGISHATTPATTLTASTLATSTPTVSLLPPPTTLASLPPIIHATHLKLPGTAKPTRGVKPMKPLDNREAPSLRTSEIIRLEQQRIAEKQKRNAGHHERMNDDKRVGSDDMSAQRQFQSVSRGRVGRENLQPSMRTDHRSDSHRNSQEDCELPRRDSIELQSDVRRDSLDTLRNDSLDKAYELNANRLQREHPRLDSLLEPLPLLARPRASSLDTPFPLQIEPTSNDPNFLPPRRVVRPEPQKFSLPNLKPSFRAPGGPIHAALSAVAADSPLTFNPPVPAPLTRRVSPAHNTTSPHDSPVMFGQLAGGWQPPLAAGPLPPLNLRREPSLPHVPVGIRGLKAETVDRNVPHPNGIAVSMMGGMAPLQLQLSDSSPLNLANSDPIDPEFGSSLFSASLLNSPPPSFRNFTPSTGLDTASSTFSGFRPNSSFLNPLPPPPIGVRKPPPGLPPPGFPRPFDDRI